MNYLILSHQKEPAEVGWTTCWDVSFWSCCGYVQLVGDLEVNPDHAGGITYLSWTGKHLGISREELEGVARKKDVSVSLLSLIQL